MASSTKHRTHLHKESSTGERRPARKKDRRLSAGTANRFDLYQRSVNSPETDVDFLIEAYETIRGRKPSHLREDFCGTANLAAEFLARDPKNTVEGFDLDPEPMKWGKGHNFGRVEDRDARMTWHEKDVRSPADKAPDVTIAANFSYWGFKEREELLGYLRSAHEDLAQDGIMVMDLYGGPEALNEMEEVRDIDGAFDYIWDQKIWEPGTGRYQCSIHFRFRDGSEMTDAFTYDWRFWHLTELRDILLEAGFSKVTCYFEGTDPDDETEGDGIFTPDPVGENCDAWLAYLVSEK